MVRLSSIALALGTIAANGTAASTNGVASGTAELAVEVEELEGEDAVCPAAPEIVVLQDTSESLRPVGEQLASSIKDTLAGWKQSFSGNVKLGVVSFTDKALPLRGWGHQRYWTEYADDDSGVDTCYDLGTGLTADEATIERALDSMTWRMGGDLPEAQYEALFNAVLDPKMKWSPRSREKDAAGRKITRIAVVITDDISHKAGDASAGIAHYNAPFAQDAAGGWCSPGFSSLPASVRISPSPSRIVFKDPKLPTQNSEDSLRDSSKDKTPDDSVTGDPEGVKRSESSRDPWTEVNYKKLVGLCRKMALGNNLTKKEQQALAYYEDIFGPKKVPQVPAHPGKFITDKGCSSSDYVQLRDVKLALERTGVLPVFLVTVNPLQMNPVLEAMCVSRWKFPHKNKKILDPKERLRCIKTWYEKELRENKIEGIVESFENEDDVVAALQNAVVQAADYSCMGAPPASATGTPTTSSTTTTEAGGVLTRPGPHSVPNAVPLPEARTEGYVPPDERSKVSTGEGEAGDNSQSRFGVITGAAGGAAACLAIMGGILYKTVGAGRTSENTAHAPVSAEERVEDPDCPLEREAMEEVTTEMFQ